MDLFLRLVHGGLAVALVGWLAMHLVDGRSELAKVRGVADAERADNAAIQADILKGEALRDGLKRDDPYVIEYLARERLQYTGPNELTPPPQK
jgi:hypothetical protein